MPRIAYKDLTKSDEMAEKLEMSTAEIGLSVRTTNCLEERGIFTVHDLLNCTRADLLSISNFGEKTLEEVYKSLEKIGFFRAQKPAACDPECQQQESVAQAS
jgi:DNA-directed RNA polymerase subunit alpha